MVTAIRDLEVLLGRELNDEEWDEVCLIILNELRAEGYEPFSVCYN